MKEKITLYTKHRKLLADTHTPVGVYLQLRDRFAGTVLLESSDYHGQDNSYSYICADPIAEFKIENNVISMSCMDVFRIQKPIDFKEQVQQEFEKFIGMYAYTPGNFKFMTNGFFGYTGFESVRYFENIEMKTNEDPGKSIPDMLYKLFRFVLVFDHFKNELHLFHHDIEDVKEDRLKNIESLIANKNVAQHPFSVKGNIESNLSDEQFKQNVSKGKEHCQLGDVFQLVLSREFNTAFSGDEFNVYRALRSVNPSPYLFYFDMGSFKLFGSSPEAQLIVKNGMAEIHPIAGTFRRTGNDAADAELAEKLKNDKKENAEHVMLVDLARNDLSRQCNEVKVEVFREVQYYSHVIHMVSKVSGRMKNSASVVRIAGDTFPAGTLSGAPKYKALQLISAIENNPRSYYGGCIGIYGLNHEFNHAIVIRSFLSKGNNLYWRAGAGVVKDSSEETELQEVNNKLAALIKALEIAETSLS